MHSFFVFAFLRRSLLWPTLVPYCAHNIRVRDLSAAGPSSFRSFPFLSRPFLSSVGEPGKKEGREVARYGSLNLHFAQLFRPCELADMFFIVLLSSIFLPPLFPL